MVNKEQIHLLERRLEFLKKWSKLWEENASIQQVSLLVTNKRYADVTDAKEFVEKLSDLIHDQLNEDEGWFV